MWIPRCNLCWSGRAESAFITDGECRVSKYLECFIHTAAEHEELNGGGEVVESLEKLGHHLGSVMAGAKNNNKLNKCWNITKIGLACYIFAPSWPRKCQTISGFLNNLSGKFCNVADPVPFWPLDPGSGMSKRSGSKSGMNNLDHISKSKLRNNFLG